MSTTKVTKWLRLTPAKSVPDCSCLSCHLNRIRSTTGGTMPDSRCLRFASPTVVKENAIDLDDRKI